MKSTHTIAKTQEKIYNKLSNAGIYSIISTLESKDLKSIISTIDVSRNRVYTPSVTLSLFLRQALNSDKSCRNIVSSFALENSALSSNDISINTASYCNARAKIPEEIIKKLVQELGNNLISKIPNSFKIDGRSVKAVDGTTVKMPDTLRNQAEYPQHSNQQEGAGFPIARMVAIISVITGAVLDYSIGAYKGKGTGEQSLYRQISNNIEPYDILLADRYYPSFFFMAELINKGADAICQAQSQRNYDFRTGNKIGKNEHIVQWEKPNKPEWMTQEEYELYPDEIKVREFKRNNIIYVTTLLDPKRQSAKIISEIYKMRWDIEVNFNSIKTTLGMDFITCKSPEMARKEIGIHFLAYNIIRSIIIDSCLIHNKNPREISFKGTLQLVISASGVMLQCSILKFKKIHNEMLKRISTNIVGKRPGRVEPRMVKSRAKSFRLLTGHREVERMKILKNRCKNKKAS